MQVQSQKTQRAPAPRQSVPFGLDTLVAPKGATRSQRGDSSNTTNSYEDDESYDDEDETSSDQSLKEFRAEFAQFFK